MSLSCKGVIARVVCMLLLIADICIAWYSYHQMREDIGDIEEDPSKSTDTLCTEGNIHKFWKIYIGFEAFSSLFKLIQIIQLSMEICNDEKHAAKWPFFWVLAQYISEIGTGLTTIIFLSTCAACADLSPSTWSVGKTELIKKFVSGAGLVAVQLLIHATSIIKKCCTLYDIHEERREEPGRVITVINIVSFVVLIVLIITEISFVFC